MANQAETEITLVNLFTVEPEKQQSAADKITEIYRTIVSEQPGFISAKIHKSLDGTRVVVIAQWTTQKVFEAMQHNPDFQNASEL